MTISIQGIYRSGKVELTDVPANMPDETPVIVTFLSENAIDLAKRGIDIALAAEQRSRLAPFAPDWEAPEMDVYDTAFAEINPAAAPLRPVGLCAGEFSVPDDFDVPLPEDVIREFEGE